MSRRESLLSAPYQTRPPEGEDARGADRWLRGLSLAATIAALATIVLGALVRATGAGDACGSTWPVCNGHWIPAFDAKVLIEYSHRSATPVLTVLIGGLAFVALRRYRGVRRVVLPAVSAFGLLFVQAALGAVVIKHRLDPALVAFHLGTAFLLVGSLVAATVASWSLRRPILARDATTRRAWLAAGAVYVALVAGAYVRGRGAGLAFRDWPLMGGGAVPDFGSANQVAQWIHRLLALVLVPVVAWLARAAWRARAERPAMAMPALIAAAALVAQIAAGAANVWTRLAVPAIVAHVAFAALLWAAAVAAAAAARIGAPERP